MNAKIKDIKDFKTLIAYLCGVLGWPIDPDSKEDDITFEYDPAELGIVEEDGRNTLIIKQLRPPKHGWPWGIFYIDFTKSRLPVVLLRRTLKQFVEKKRYQNPGQPVWKMQNLIFVCFFGSDEGRGTSIVYFIQQEHKLPVLKVIAWDQYDTDRHIEAVEKSLLKLSWPQDLSALDDWKKQWGSAFQLEHRYVINTSKQLSFELAKCASRIRKYVLSAFKIERNTGPLHKLYDDFKKILIHDLADTDFADMYAQTIAYGLFSARCMDNDGHFELSEIVERIPETNPFLKNLLHQCMGFQGASKGKMDLEELGVDELVELLGAIDMKAIQDDFGRQRKGEDPVIHLYEGFMNEYDKKQKVRRGEFYTPDPVVSFIVRAVDSILMDKFGCNDGLADMSTWGELVEKDVIKRPEWAQHHNSTEWKKLSKEPFVQILDPATGTGTFLKYVVLQIHKNFMESIHEKSISPDFKQNWNEYVQRNLLPRLNGFELKMAPYAVAHMKLGMTLRDLGYDFKEKKRLNVFITNTLEKPYEYAGTLFADFLAKEANLADQIKKENPVTIIIGNPPYSVSSANNSSYIEKLMMDYKEDVRKEKNIQPLSDDYIKFIRFTHEKIKETGCGIIGMITNNSYLSGIIHRGMRKKLIEYFNEVYILNLHGSARVKAPNNIDVNDENVFDIQQGVAIILLVKNNQEKKTSIYYEDLIGSRDSKYTFLNNQSINNIKWKNIEAKAPYYFFIPRGIEEEEYKNYVSIKDIFIKGNAGVATGKDDILVSYNKNELMNKFESDNKSDFCAAMKNNGVNQLLIEKWYKELKDSDIESQIKQYCYRPYDVRLTIYNDKVAQRLRRVVMDHMLSDNLALITTKQLADLPFRHCFVTNTIADRCLVSLKTKEVGYFFPSYLYENEKVKSPILEKISNINQKFITAVCQALNIKYTADLSGDLVKNLGSNDIFYYIYAILHSLNYRTQYAEHLKIDFPHIPTTSNKELFKQLVVKGNELVRFHLLNKNPFDKSKSILDNPKEWGVMTGGERLNDIRDWEITNIHYEEICKRVYINANQYFEEVHKDTWEFIIGSYQVCEKWLKDRKKAGRCLSKDDREHYMKIVVAIRETIRLMKEIDVVIDQHGGWPKAFA